MVAFCLPTSDGHMIVMLILAVLWRIGGHRGIMKNRSKIRLLESIMG